VNDWEASQRLELPTDCRPNSSNPSLSEPTRSPIHPQFQGFSARASDSSTPRTSEFEIFQIFEGTNQIQRVVIGANIAKRVFS
jgi:hypothetical protein